MTATPIRPGLRDIARAVRPGPIFVGLVAVAILGGWLCAPVSYTHLTLPTILRV